MASHLPGAEELERAEAALAERDSVRVRLVLGPAFEPNSCEAVVLSIAERPGGTCSTDPRTDASLEGQSRFASIVEWYVPDNVEYRGAGDYWASRWAKDPIAKARLVWVGHHGFRESCREIEAALEAEARLMRPRGDEHSDRPTAGRGKGTASRADGTLAVSRLVAATAEAEALFERLSAEVFGQDLALRHLADMVTRHRYRKARRPGVALLVGPTGTGKTRTAEKLAESLEKQYPREGWHYTRIDGGTLLEAHAIARLTGAPPGYVGFESAQSLADILAAHPKTVVLVDEIEKATQNIYPILLSVLDEGRLVRTHSPDRAVDATACVFLATTNRAADELVAALERSDAWTDAGARSNLCRQALLSAGLQREFIGRLQAVLPFRPLDPVLRARIAEHTIRRIAGDYGVSVADVAPSVVQAVLAETNDTRFGARPDEHVVDDLLSDAFLAVVPDPKRRHDVVGPPFVCRAVGAVPDHFEEA